MAKPAPVRVSNETANERVKPQHLEILRLTKHLAARDENFCEVMKELGTPVAIEEIQRRPVPVMMCLRVAAIKVCGLGLSSFMSVVNFQLRFSSLLQDWEVRRKLGMEWDPGPFAGADPSKLSDAVEENTSRAHTLALVDELIERIEKGVTI